MFLVKDAEKIATKAHKGQYRRGNKIPYIVHPKAVAESFVTNTDQIVGWLHDVVEDTNLTIIELLKNGVPCLAVVAIEALTKNESEHYLDYILRVKQNKIATRIKIADMHDNAKTATKSQKEKYALAEYILSTKKGGKENENNFLGN